MPGPSVNLLALLRPDEVTVRVAGHPFVLTASTASQWLGAIALDMTGLSGIMPGLVADDDLDMMEHIITTHPDVETRWLNAARTALGRSGGRDWWWTLNLSRKSLQAWIYVNGALLRQNVDSRKLGFADWLDACYTMLWQGAKEEDQIKLDLELSAKPAGIAVAQSSAAVKQMLSDFAAD